MAGFSIDDVRETFTADMTNLLAQVERATAAIDVAPLLDDQAWTDAPPLFEAVGDSLHAIAGTSGLVSASSLHQSAKRLEALCADGVLLLQQAAASSARARRIARICADGVAEMRAMLALELEHRGPEALSLAISFVESASRGASEPAPARPAEFDFEEDRAASVAEELGAVFREEVDELMAKLAGDLAALRARPGATDVLAQIERVFHSLRGAAATVGRLEVRDAAEALRELAFQALEHEGPPDPALADTLADRTEAMLRDADLGELPATARSVAAPIEEGPASFSFAVEAGAEAPVDDELGEIFRKEAGEALLAVDGHLDALAARGDDTTALDAAERIFHTIKGAAATVGNAAASRLAADLQHELEEISERGGGVDAALLARLQTDVETLRALAGLPPVAPRPAAASSVAEGDSMATARADFADEARRACADLRALIAQLPDAGPRAADVRAEIGRHFHRLKGSALITGASTAAAEAARAHDLLLSGEALGAATLAEAVSRIEAALGGPRRSIVGADQPQREAVTIPTDVELWDTFVQEAQDLLERLDRAVLDLESSARPHEGLSALGGLVHSLKGAVNTVGLAPTGRVLHRVEDLLDALAVASILPPVRGIVTLLARVTADVRRNLGEARRGYVETALGRVEAEIARLGAGDDLTGASVDAAAGSRRASVRSSGGPREPSADVVAERSFVRVGTERLDTLMNLAGELVVARSRLMNRVGSLRRLQTEMGASRQRLVDTVDRFRSDNEFSFIAGRGAGHDGAASGPKPHASSVGAAAPRPREQGLGAFTELELDRYDNVNILARSLAELTDDVSETNGQLLRELGGFAEDSDAFGAIVSGIQSEVTRARMVPLDVVFSRLLLPVRDAAAREGKEVRVATRGEHVSLDKAIADALVTPLLHLVRNAVAHGIEAPPQRAGAGKDRVGVISLSAREESGQIVVEVRDDGRGLDLAALRTRGAAMGLVRADVPLADPTVADLVFAPKLSTLAAAGDVAGRGLGGDVVRRSIERLNGRIHVHSEAGRGTAFSITLPLTLTITRALVIRHRARLFAVPLHFAERILDADEASVLESAGVARVKVGDGYLPLRTLDSVLRVEGDGARRGRILVLRVGEQRAALQIDALVGQEEIVVKSLGHLLTGHPMFAGITIRGTGELVLILDAPAILESGERRAERAPEAPAVERADSEIASTPAPASTITPVAARPVEPKPAPAPAARPIEPKPAPSHPPVARQPAPKAQAPKLRVLFVDDSLSVRKVAEKTLASLGAEVTLAVDGVDALAKLREIEVDLVFTDLEMPRMHGYELIRELRFIPAYAGLPVVVVSSRSTQKHQDQAQALGASDYLTKPFTAQTLDAALKRWGGRPKGGRGT